MNLSKTVKYFEFFLHFQECNANKTNDVLSITHNQIIDITYMLYEKHTWKLRQTSVDPVNPTLSTSGWVAKADPNRPSPVTTLKTPAGKPASAQMSANSNALSLV